MYFVIFMMISLISARKTERIKRSSEQSDYDEYHYYGDNIELQNMIVYDDYGNNYQNYNWHNFNDGWDGWHRKHHNSMKIVSMSMKMTKKNVELELSVNDFAMNLNVALIQVQ